MVLPVQKVLPQCWNFPLYGAVKKSHLLILRIQELGQLVMSFLGGFQGVGGDS